MAKDYKDTLNLPQTDFPMKANLAQKSLSCLGCGRKKSFMRRFGNGIKPVRLILHDGPPYANGQSISAMR